MRMATEKNNSVNGVRLKQQLRSVEQESGERNKNKDNEEKMSNRCAVFVHAPPFYIEIVSLFLAPAEKR